ncbi:MAG TPA: hypothetical protein VGY98_08245 [Verrucomicrobiae bacterium]|nr:hypothetical protein [Verrucomicrobiae bacterium]
MSAERSLFEAYREWQRLAKACQKAISLRNWDFLLQCQGAIKELQPSIAVATLKVRDEWNLSRADRTAEETRLRATILELMALLEANKKLLHDSREMALTKRKELDLAGQNLRRIQISYGSAQRATVRGIA